MEHSKKFQDLGSCTVPQTQVLNEYLDFYIDQQAISSRSMCLPEDSHFVSDLEMWQWFITCVSKLHSISWPQCPCLNLLDSQTSGGDSVPWRLNEFFVAPDLIHICYNQICTYWRCNTLLLYLKISILYKIQKELKSNFTMSCSNVYMITHYFKFLRRHTYQPMKQINTISWYF